MVQDENEFARRAHVDRPAPIDVEDEPTRSAWCAEFGTSEAELRAAVAAVGKMPLALRFYLRHRLAAVEALSDGPSSKRSTTRSPKRG